MRHTLVLAAILLCAAASAQVAPPLPTPPAPVGKPKTDPRLIQALDAAGMKYNVLPDGNCRMGFILPNGRHQVVTVQTHTERLGSLELREIGSMADSMACQLSKDIIVKMMMETSKQKIGAWEIIPLKGTEYDLILVARLPVNRSVTEILCKFATLCL